MKRGQFILLATLLIASIPLFAAKGTVKYTSGSCSWYLVETSSGFALLEWFGGNTPSKGDVIVGDYESFDMKTLYNLTRDRETKVWVDNYWLSKDSAIEKFYERCR